MNGIYLVVMHVHLRLNVRYVLIGKLVSNLSTKYRCYAASSERFPAVREHRWRNFDYVKEGKIPEIPNKCKAVRIHASGDFFNQKYFDMWLDICKTNPDIEFWAFTKSINYWVNRINEIPDNLVLTASYGGKYDHLISEHNLKHTIVYSDFKDVPFNTPIDTNDDYARIKDINFALLDNNKKHEEFIVKQLKI